jgi:hypothetical protein
MVKPSSKSQSLSRISGKVVLMLGINSESPNLSQLAQVGTTRLATVLFSKLIMLSKMVGLKLIL